MKSDSMKKWSSEDIEETLYKSDEDPAYRIIHEIKYEPPTKPFKKDPSTAFSRDKGKEHQHRGSDGGEDLDPLSEQRVEKKNDDGDEDEPPAAVLDLDLSDGQIHIVEFYAPW